LFLPFPLLNPTLFSFLLPLSLSSYSLPPSPPPFYFPLPSLLFWKEEGKRKRGKEGRQPAAGGCLAF
jgi:hypothetical protein